MELFNLTGKTALITGASSGLGRRMALTLASAGAKVIVTARRVEMLESLVHEIKNSDGNAEAIFMDVSKKESICQALNGLAQKKQPIDILINNAGIFRLTPIFEEGENDPFEEVYQTNVIGLWHLTKLVANHMKNLNIEGSIINISSIAGTKTSRTDRAAYSSSKAAVVRMTEQLVGELSEHKIRINAVAPGLFKTEMTEDMLKDYGDRVYNLIPLGYVPNPEDLDGVILLLASNKASRYITGSCITVDGGISWGGLYNL